MEPARPLVDHAVLSLVRDHTFASADFVLTERGVCRLHPQLARRMIESFPKAATLATRVDRLALTLTAVVAA